MAQVKDEKGNERVVSSSASTAKTSASTQATAGMTATQRGTALRSAVAAKADAASGATATSGGNRTTYKTVTSKTGNVKSIIPTSNTSYGSTSTSAIKNYREVKEAPYLSQFENSTATTQPEKTQTVKTETPKVTTSTPAVTQKNSSIFSQDSSIKNTKNTSGNTVTVVDRAKGLADVGIPYIGIGKRTYEVEAPIGDAVNTEEKSSWLSQEARDKISNDYMTSVKEKYSGTSKATGDSEKTTSWLSQEARDKISEDYMASVKAKYKGSVSAQGETTPTENVGDDSGWLSPEAADKIADEYMSSVTAKYSKTPEESVAPSEESEKKISWLSPEAREKISNDYMTAVKSKTAKLFVERYTEAKSNGVTDEEFKKSHNLTDEDMNYIHANAYAKDKIAAEEAMQERWNNQYTSTTEGYERLREINQQIAQAKIGSPDGPTVVSTRTSGELDETVPVSTETELTDEGQTKDPERTNERSEPALNYEGVYDQVEGAVCTPGFNFKGETDADGNYVPAAIVFYRDRKLHYDHLLDVYEVLMSSWQDEESMTHLMDLSATLYFDYKKLLESDENITEELFKGWNISPDEFKQDVAGLMEACRLIYNDAAAKNEYYGYYDDHNLLDVTDGTWYDNGYSPDEIQSMIDWFSQFGEDLARTDLFYNLDPNSKNFVDDCAVVRMVTEDPSLRDTFAKGAYSYLFEKSDKGIKEKAFNFQYVIGGLETALTQSNNNKSAIEEYNDSILLGRNYIGYEVLKEAENGEYIVDVDATVEKYDAELLKLQEAEKVLKEEGDTVALAQNQKLQNYINRILGEYSSVELYNSIEAEGLSTEELNQRMKDLLWEEVTTTQDATKPQTKSGSDEDEAKLKDIDTELESLQEKLTTLDRSTNRKEYNEAYSRKQELLKQREELTGKKTNASVGQKIGEKAEDVAEDAVYGINARYEGYRTDPETGKVYKPITYDDLSAEDKILYGIYNSLYSLSLSADRMAWNNEIKAKYGDGRTAYNTQLKTVEDLKSELDSAENALNDAQLEIQKALDAMPGMNYDPGMYEGIAANDKEARVNVLEKYWEEKCPDIYKNVYLPAKQKYEEAREKYDDENTLLHGWYSDIRFSDIDKDEDYDAKVEKGKMMFNTGNDGEGLFTNFMTNKLGLRGPNDNPYSIVPLTEEEEKKVTDYFNALVSGRKGGTDTISDVFYGITDQKLLDNFYYLLANDGLLTALQYVGRLNQKVDESGNDEIDKRNQLIAKGAFGIGKVSGTITSLGVPWITNLTSIVSLGTVAQRTYQQWKTEGDYWSKAYDAKEAADSFTTALGSEMASVYPKLPDTVTIDGMEISLGPLAGKDASFLYSSYISGVNSTEWMLIGGGIAKALGLAGKTIQIGDKLIDIEKAFTTGVVDSVFAFSAMSDSLADRLKKGQGVEQAFWGSFCSGLCEAAFEHISLDKLYDAKDITNFKEWIIQTAINSGIEGSEEIATNFGNWLTDEIVAGLTGGTGAYDEAICAYMERGYTEDQAKKLVMRDRSIENVDAFVSAFLSSVGSTGVRGARGYFDAKNYGDYVNALEANKDNRLTKNVADFILSDTVHYKESTEDGTPLMTDEQVENRDKMVEAAEAVKNGDFSSTTVGAMFRLFQTINTDALSDFIMKGWQNAVDFLSVNPSKVISSIEASEKDFLGDNSGSVLAHLQGTDAEVMHFNSFEDYVKNRVEIGNRELLEVESVIKSAVKGNIEANDIFTLLRERGIELTEKSARAVYSWIYEQVQKNLSFINRGKAPESGVVTQVEMQAPVDVSDDNIFSVLMTTLENISNERTKAKEVMRFHTLVEFQKQMDDIREKMQEATQRNHTLTSLLQKSKEKAAQKQAEKNAKKDEQKDTSTEESVKEEPIDSGVTLTEEQRDGKDSVTLTINDKTETYTRDQYVAAYVDGKDIIDNKTIENGTAEAANATFDTLMYRASIGTYGDLGMKSNYAKGMPTTLKEATKVGTTGSSKSNTKTPGVSYSGTGSRPTANMTIDDILKSVENTISTIDSNLSRLGQERVDVSDLDTLIEQATRLEGFVRQEMNNNAKDSEAAVKELNTRLTNVNNKIAAIRTYVDSRRDSKSISDSISTLTSEKQKLENERDRYKFVHANASRNAKKEGRRSLSESIDRLRLGIKALTEERDKINRENANGRTSTDSASIAQRENGVANTAAELAEQPIDGIVVTEGDSYDKEGKKTRRTAVKSADEIIRGQEFNDYGKVVYDTNGKTLTEVLKDESLPMELRFEVGRALALGVTRVIVTDQSLRQLGYVANEKDGHPEFKPIRTAEAMTIKYTFDVPLKNRDLSGKNYRTNLTESVIVINASGENWKYHMTHESVHHMLYMLTDEQRKSFVATAIEYSLGGRKDYYNTLVGLYKGEYLKAYEGKEKDGKLSEEMLDAINEEIVCDLYAGYWRNAFSTDLTEAQKKVTASVYEDFAENMRYIFDRFNLSNYTSDKWIGNPQREYQYNPEGFKGTRMPFNLETSDQASNGKLIYSGKFSLNSEGDQLSEGQMEYFQNSKVRDENGRLQIVYHGAKNLHENVDFDLMDDGISFWLTPDRYTALTYSGTSSRESLFDTKEEKFDRWNKDIQKDRSATFDRLTDALNKLFDVIYETHDYKDVRDLMETSLLSQDLSDENVAKQLELYDSLINDIITRPSMRIVDPGKELTPANIFDPLSRIANNVKDLTDLRPYFSATGMDLYEYDQSVERQVENVSWRDMDGKRKEILSKLGGEYRSLIEEFKALELQSKQLKDEVIKECKNSNYYPRFESQATLGKNLMLYANMENPLVIDAEGKNWNDITAPKSWFPKDEGLYWYATNRFGVWMIEPKESSDPDSYIVTTRLLARHAKLNGYDGLIVKNVIDHGAALGWGSQVAFPFEYNPTSTVMCVFDSNQVKDIRNENPTKSDNFKYSISEEALPAVQSHIEEGNSVPPSVEVRYSTAMDSEFLKKAEGKNKKNKFVGADIFSDAGKIRNVIQNIFENGNRAETIDLAKTLGVDEEGVRLINEVFDNWDQLKLPEDNVGDTLITDSSYGGTEENTTVCVRSLAAQAMMDEIAKVLGRPLTVEDTIFISQELENYTDKPECIYCYVAMDRRSYRQYLGDYLGQRNSVLNNLKNGMPDDTVYKQFLNKREDSDNMKTRFRLFKMIAEKGNALTSSELSSVDAIVKENGNLRYEILKYVAEKNNLNPLKLNIVNDANEGFKITIAKKGDKDQTLFTGTQLMNDSEISDTAYRFFQINDAMNYAQGASWAKKMMSYTAYNGHILSWRKDRIEKFNKHYGLRMYSFSDYSPAFILENMQMVTDAAVMGLKMLAYTKELDFVEIFAKTGMNINISVFASEVNGQITPDAMMGADWERAKQLRDQYPNVGITMVATTDKLVDYALDQDWVDVVIPYHIVRTGKELADALNITNYTDTSSDKKIEEIWSVKSKEAKKKDQASVYPSEHNNDVVAYISRLDELGLTPRFEQYLVGLEDYRNGKITDDEFRAMNNGRYMKLVNETRQTANDTPVVQPNFNLDAAIKSIRDMEKRGGYNPPFGGSVDTQADIAEEIANKIQSNTQRESELTESIETGKTKYGKTSSELDKRKLNTDMKASLSDENVYDQNDGVGYSSVDEQTLSGKERASVVNEKNDLSSKNNVYVEIDNTQAKGNVKFSYGEILDQLFDTSKPAYTDKHGNALYVTPNANALHNYVWDDPITPQQRKNIEYNNRQTETGAPLKTIRKGTATGREVYVERLGTKVGKIMSGELYAHKSFMADIVPDDVRDLLISKIYESLNNLKEDKRAAFDGFTYNCFKYNPKTQRLALQEAPDFDTAREPRTGKWLAYELSTGKFTYGESEYIWHHKWEWVTNDYTGFDKPGDNSGDGVRRAWEWSRTFYNTLSGATYYARSKSHGAYQEMLRGDDNGIADGNGIERWNAQLTVYGLPLDEGQEFTQFEGPAWSPSTWVDENGDVVLANIESYINGYITDEEGNALPIFGDIEEDEEATEENHKTANSGTLDTYYRFYMAIKEDYPDTWQKIRILDASSGLGLGARLGRELGFNVVDIEPYWSPMKYGSVQRDTYGKSKDTKEMMFFKADPHHEEKVQVEKVGKNGKITYEEQKILVPDEPKSPTYTDYSQLYKDVKSGKIEPFDFIIGNAVINVCCQSDRDNYIATNYGLLAPGGTLYLNTMKYDYNAGTRKNAANTIVVPQNEGRGDEVFVMQTKTIQKAFGSIELREYVKDVVTQSSKEDAVVENVKDKRISAMNAVMATKPGENKNRVKLSVSDSTSSIKQDSEYLSYVKNGDMENAQRMVDEAAMNAGYTRKVYHGTKNGKFNVFKFGRSGIYTTPDESLASLYGDVMSLYAKEVENELVVDADGSPFFSIPKENINLDFDKYPLLRGKDSYPTDNISQIAFAEGYDSVVINNVYDSPSMETGYGKLSTDIVLKESSQVKSADPVTYDDNGEVIPLSQRFNAGTEDIRYSLSDDLNEAFGIEEDPMDLSLDQIDYLIGRCEKNISEFKDSDPVYRRLEPQLAKLKTWKQNDAEELFNKVREAYGTTDDFNKTGFILPNGDMLDMSQGTDHRVTWHEDVNNYIDKASYSYMNRGDAVVFFVAKGAVRVDETDGIQIPIDGVTKEQIDVLRDYFDYKIDTPEFDRMYFYVEASGFIPKSTRYTKLDPHNSARFINSLKKYNAEKEFLPDYNAFDSARYSVADNISVDHIGMVNVPGSVLEDRRIFTDADTSYENVVDPLMGFRKNNTNTEYKNQKYKYNLNLWVSTDGGEKFFFDAIKGLNRNHAIGRALRNWTGDGVILKEPTNRDIEIATAYSDLWDMYNRGDYVSEEQATDTDTELVKFSLAPEGYEPKNVQWGFKLMAVDENGLPHAMFIDSAVPYELDRWYLADSPKMDDLLKLDPGVYLMDKDGSATKIDKKTPSVKQINEASMNGQRYMRVSVNSKGEKLIHNFGITQTQDLKATKKAREKNPNAPAVYKDSVSKYALRPGLHAVDITSMTHIGALTGRTDPTKVTKKGKEKDIRKRRPDQRWFLIEYPVDQDYNLEAYSHKSKDIQDHLPTNGWYSFQTNSNAEGKQHWFITGAMKIVGAVSEQDARDYAVSQGFEPDVLWEDGKSYDDSVGAIDLKKYITEHQDTKTPSKTDMKKRIEKQIKENKKSDTKLSVSDQSENNYAPIFYSHMANVVDGIKQDKLGAASVVNYLKGKGVKNEEIKWSGIEQFLDGKKSVTKEELQEFVKNSDLKIEETTLDSKMAPMSQDAQYQIDKLTIGRTREIEFLKKKFKEITGSDIVIPDNMYARTVLRRALLIKDAESNQQISEVCKQYIDCVKQVREMTENDSFGFESPEAAFAIFVSRPYEIRVTVDLNENQKRILKDLENYSWKFDNENGLNHFSGYSKREYLYRLADSIDAYYTEIDDIKQKDSHRNATHWSDFTLEGNENYRELLFNLPKTQYTNRAMQTHWNREDAIGDVDVARGILAHARVDDAYTKDGDLILFIEEIQSDWHNEGNKKGYIASKKEQEKLRQEYVRLESEVKQMERDLESWQRSLQPGEFAKALMNAKVGKDGHYNDDIGYGDRTRKIAESWKKVGEARKAWLDSEEGVPDAPFKDTYTDFVLKRLLRMAAEENYDKLGWTTAQQQIERWSDEYAEGYRIEYDQDIPGFLKKYGKQWGAQVGKEQLKNGETVWTMPITDAMKDDVLYKGQPKYSLSSTDSLGNTLTAEQREFFKDSKAVDDNGNLKVLYHGTKHGGFTTFEVSDDIGYFFTDDGGNASSYSGSNDEFYPHKMETMQDVIDYSDGKNDYIEIKKGFAVFNTDEYGRKEASDFYESKTDLLNNIKTEDENKVEKAYEFNDTYYEYKKVFSEDDVEGALDFVSIYEDEEFRTNYKVYLNLKDPLIINGNGSNWDQVVDTPEGRPLKTLDELTDDERKRIAENMGIYEDELRDYHDGYGEAIPTFDTYDEYQVWVQSTREWVAEAKDLGHDGVIFKNIFDSGPEFGGYNLESNVYVALDSNQIKSTANTKPTRHDDIRYSISDMTDEQIDNCALFINNKEHVFDLIRSGEKNVETRNNNSLHNFVGHRIGIIETGKGLVGFATIGKEFVWNTPEEFYNFDKTNGQGYKHGITRNTKNFEFKNVKYGYSLENITWLDEPVSIPKTGVARYGKAKENNARIATATDISWYYDDQNEKYRKAVEAADTATARRIFMNKLMDYTSPEVVPFLFAAPYAGSNNITTAREIKKGNDAPEELQKAAKAMSSFVPDNSVLIPIPSSKGYATDTLDLANAIAKITGSPVVDALEGESRMSQYKSKTEKHKTLGPSDMGVRLKEGTKLPTDKYPIFIDNVVASGNTAKAAKDAVGKGIVLAYAYGSKTKPTKGLKTADFITVDNDQNFIPLNERLNPNNKDVKFSVAGEQSRTANQKNLEVAKYALSPDQIDSLDSNFNGVLIDELGNETFDPEFANKFATSSSITSDNTIYRTADNTTFVPMDDGSIMTIPFDPNSEEVKYTERLKNNDNGTAERTYTIPRAQRNGNDGYRSNQQDAGLRRGQTGLSPVSQTGETVTGSNNPEVLREGQPQSQKQKSIIPAKFSTSSNTEGYRYIGEDLFENENVFENANSYEKAGEDVRIRLDTNSRLISDAIRTGDIKQLENMINDCLERRADATTEAVKRIDEQINNSSKINPAEHEANVRAWNKLLQEFGFIEKGERAKNDIQVPKKYRNQNTGDIYNVSKATRTVMENSPEWLNDVNMNRLLTEEIGVYQPTTNAKDMNEALDFVRKKGYKNALNYWRAVVESEGIPKASDIAIAERLLADATAQGAVDDAKRIIADLCALAPELGQAVQAYRMLKLTGPTGNYYYIERVIGRLNKQYEKRIGRGKMNKIVINGDLTKRLLKARTQAEMDSALDAIKQDIANQIPMTFVDRANAWRYMAMLANPPTHIRNLLGNAAFSPVVAFKNIIAHGLESTSSPNVRTHASAFTNKNSSYYKLAKDDFDDMVEVIMGKSGKYFDINEIKQLRRDMFGSDTKAVSKALNTAWKKLEDINANAHPFGIPLGLENGDMVFLKSYYQSALAQYLEAHGVKEDGIYDYLYSTKEGRKMLNQARSWAIREAQRNTYRSFSIVASKINAMKRGGGISGVLIDGFLPFTKTPANILRRGIEYSPFGLVEGIVHWVQSANAEMTPENERRISEAIDETAAGITGTGLLLIGMLLANLGILRGAGPDDDDEAAFEKLQGHQNYSIEIGSHSYTLDWLAPAAIPLFLGAAAMEVLSGEREALGLNSLEDVASQLVDPLMNLTMLSGVNSTLGSLSYAADNAMFSTLLVSMGSSYLGQYFPTIMGQLARTVDPYRRTTYIDKNSSIPSTIQSFVQKSIYGKTPGLSQQRMKYVDAWGRTEGDESIGGYFVRALENFLSPGYYNKITTTDVDKELADLYSRTKDPTVLPDMQNKKFNITNDDGTKSEKKLTADEYEAMSIDTGSMKYKYLNDLFNTEEYKSMTDDEKVKAVGEIMNYSTNVGRYNISEKYNLADSWMDKAMDTDPVGYVILRNELGSDKSVWQQAKAILDSDYFDMEEKSYLLSTEFDAPFTVSSDTTGYNLVLTDGDREYAEELYTDLYFPQKFEEMLNTDVWKEAEQSGDEETMQKLYSDCRTEAKELVSAQLAEELKNSGRDLKLGSAGGLAINDACAILRKDPNAGSDWFAGVYSSGSRIDDPDNTGYQYSLSATQKTEAKTVFKKRFESAYNELIRTENYKSANDTYKDRQIRDVYDRVKREVNQEYARTLAGRGVKSVLADTEDVNYETRYHILSTQNVTLDFALDYLGRAYSGGTSINGTKLTWEQKEYRKELYNEVLRNGSGSVPSLEKKLAQIANYSYDKKVSELEKYHKKVYQATNSTMEKKFGL